jgi:hypothetical protein
LLWSVSDHLQSKRADEVDVGAYEELWMYLLHQLLASCHDGRQEVRDGAISTIFRSISTYGTTLSSATWHACLWQIVFPIFESLSSGLETALRENPLSNEEQLVVQVNGPPIRLIEKQWDDSKTLSLSSMGSILSDYLSTKLLAIAEFNETWITFINLLKMNFLEGRPQVGTSAMKALEKVLVVPLATVQDSSKVPELWEVAWKAWDEIGFIIATDLNSTPSPSIGSPTPAIKAFTQINLEAYSRIAAPLYEPGYINFDLDRINRLLHILKSVLTFTHSPDFRSDVDTLSPLQASILDIISILKLDIPGAASAVLSDLSEYSTLAFVAAFDAEPPRVNGRDVLSQRVSYIALSKETMPLVLDLFQRFKDDESIYSGGAVERMFSVRSLISASVINVS